MSQGGTDKKTWVLALGLALGWLTAERGEAANCALRNPDRQIYAIFPGATGYRSVVERIGTKTRRAIETQLGEDLAFNDLGKHTLYIVQRKQVPIGFVHVRSEIGESGTVEFVWALDLDLKVKDFRIQRSREKHTKVLKGPAFRGRLVGGGVARLMALRALGDEDLDLPASKEAAPLCRKAILSGAKTIAITKHAFAKAVTRARLLGNVYRFFPGAAKVTRIPAPRGEDTASVIRDRLAGEAARFELDSFVLVRALAQENKTLGVVVFTRWAAHPAKPELWWAVSPAGTIRKALILGKVDATVSDKVHALRGKALADLKSAAPSTPARCAAEVLAVLSHLGVGG